LLPPSSASPEDPTARRASPLGTETWFLKRNKSGNVRSASKWFKFSFQLLKLHVKVKACFVSFQLTVKIFRSHFRFSISRVTSIELLSHSFTDPFLFGLFLFMFIYFSFTFSTYLQSSIILNLLVISNNSLFPVLRKSATIWHKYALAH